MSNIDFDRFIQRQKTQTQETQVDWNATRTEWLRALDSLYGQIEEFLKGYLSSGDIVLRYEPVSMNEERLGAYEARRLILTIGPQQVVFVPVGALVIGARGRVDIVGSAGRIILVLVEKQSSGVKIRVSVLEPGTPASSPATPQQATEWVWKISTPPPSIKFVELTAESLMHAIMEVANA